MKREFSESWCYKMLRKIRWPNGMNCLWCASPKVTTHSKSVRSPRRKYVCRDCRRTFTDLTGTPLARTNLPLGKWFLLLRFKDEGLSTSELAKELSVKWDTTLSMQRRLGIALLRPGLIWQLREAIEEHDYE